MLDSSSGLGLIDQGGSALRREASRPRRCWLRQFYFSGAIVWTVISDGCDSFALPQAVAVDRGFSALAATVLIL